MVDKCPCCGQTIKVAKKEVIKKKIDYLDILDTWNSFAAENGLAQVTILSDNRKRWIREKLEIPEFDLKLILEKSKNSSFLLGKNDFKWRMNFEFIFERKDKWIGILEDKYLFANKTQNITDKFF